MEKIRFSKFQNTAFYFAQTAKHFAQNRNEKLFNNILEWMYEYTPYT